MRETTQTRVQWEAKAGEELGGRPLRSLWRRTADAIEVAPSYLRDAAPALDERLRARTGTGAGIGEGWLSVQEYRQVDPRAANAAARRDVELGAQGVMFIVDGDPDEVLSVLLDGIDPVRTRIWFDAGVQAPRWADVFEKWIDDRHTADQPESATLGRDPSHGGVIHDPFTPLVATGSLACDAATAFAGNVDAVLGMRAGLLGISTAVYHDAGATEADELALALSSCAELLRRGTELGLEFADLADSVIWTLPIGGRPFETIAKLRAARVVWAKFGAAAGHPHAGLWIHATPPQRMWTRHGAWVNLLRGTVAGFAAAVGGADSVATAAFDSLCGGDGGSELGRRLAIDTQLILREESRLAAVVDPPGGSWYVESLTDALARAAWGRFRELERGGGWLASVQAGTVARDIATAAERLRERAATRKLPLTGLSTYPSLDDPPTPEQSRSDAPSQGAAAPRVASTQLEVPRLAPLRLAEPFEALRDIAEQAATRPKIFACNLGPLAAHQARLEFAGNCFAAGGIELVASDGFALDDPEALRESIIAAMRASGCSLAIVCGRDQDYARWAAEVVVALRLGGAKAVWIAGRPPDGPDGWGLDPELPPRFVFVGADVLSELEFALEQEVG
jgi:methylmalonyl-CoA mutase